jgi:hypothetical protein
VALCEYLWVCCCFLKVQFVESCCWQKSGGVKTYIAWCVSSTSTVCFGILMCRGTDYFSNPESLLLLTFFCHYMCCRDSAVSIHAFVQAWVSYLQSPLCSCFVNHYVLLVSWQLADGQCKGNCQCCQPVLTTLSLLTWAEHGAWDSGMSIVHMAAV